MLKGREGEGNRDKVGGVVGINWVGGEGYGFIGMLGDGGKIVEFLVWGF